MAGEERFGEGVPPLDLRMISASLRIDWSGIGGQDFRRPSHPPPERPAVIPGHGGASTPPAHRWPALCPWSMTQTRSAAVHLLDVMGGDDDGELALLPQPAHVAPHPVTRLRVRCPTVGSSRNSTRASCTKARAISSRRFMPEESVRTMLARAIPRVRRARASPRSGWRAQRRRHAIDEPVEIEVLVQASGDRRGSAPGTRRRGCAGPPADSCTTSMPLMRRACRCRAGGWCRGCVRKRGLARAVGAEQREDFAVTHLEADASNARSPAEAACSLPRSRPRAQT